MRNLRNKLGKWTGPEITILVIVVVLHESKKGAMRLVHLLLPRRTLDAIKSKVDVVFAAHTLHPPL